MTATRSIKARNTNTQAIPVVASMLTSQGATGFQSLKITLYQDQIPIWGGNEVKPVRSKPQTHCPTPASARAGKRPSHTARAAFQLLLGRALRSYLSSSWPGSPPPVKAQPSALHSHPHFLRSPPRPLPVLGRRVPSFPDRLGPGAAAFSAEHRCHSRPPCCVRRQKRRDGRPS